MDKMYVEQRIYLDITHWPHAEEHFCVLSYVSSRLAHRLGNSNSV